MSAPILVATMALQGATIGISLELAVRSLFNTKDKNTMVRGAKFFLGLFMATKTILFLTFHTDQGELCHGIARASDLFYQLAVTLGNYILLARVQLLSPAEWKSTTKIVHIVCMLIRLVIGLVDVGLIEVGIAEDGTCLYYDRDFWGPVYTLFDTFIDAYVTVMISIILIQHVRSLESDRMKANKLLYSSVIYYNIVRTTCLTMVNLVSAIFIIAKIHVPFVMLLWPIINFLFVILVGYDSDTTKIIRSVQQRCWHNMSSVTDLPSISKENTKINLLDPEMQVNRNDSTATCDNFNIVQIERYKNNNSL